MVSLSKQHSEWIRGHFTTNAYNKQMRGEVIGDYEFAEMYLKGAEKRHRRSCGCHYGSLQRGVNELYNSYMKQYNEET